MNNLQKMSFAGQFINKTTVPDREKAKQIFSEAELRKLDNQINDYGAAVTSFLPKEDIVELRLGQDGLKSIPLDIKYIPGEDSKKELGVPANNQKYSCAIGISSIVKSIEEKTVNMDNVKNILNKTIISLEDWNSDKFNIIAAKMRNFLNIKK